MTAINPINMSWASLLPQMELQGAQQRLAEQQAALTGAQTATQQQVAQQQAIGTKIAQARLPVMLQAYAMARGGMPGNPVGAPTSPGGMPEGPPAPAVPNAAGGPPGPQPAGPPPDQSGVAPPPKPIMPPPPPQNPLDATGEQAGPGGSKTPWYNPQAVMEALRNRFFVNQAGTPAENQQLYAAAMTGDPGLANAAKVRLQQGVTRRLMESRYDSTNMYDALSTVVDAGQGDALAQLKAVAPKVAARLQAQVKDPEKQDADARAFAAYVAGEVHQYTGRAVELRPDGYYVDKLTGKVVPGVGRSGLSMPQWENLAMAGETPVAVPQSNGSTAMVPRWQAPGQNARSLTDWILKAAQGSGVWGAQPGISGGPKAEAQTMASAAAQNVHNQAVRAATAPIVAANPILQKALADPTYKLPATPPTFGTSITPQQQAIQVQQANSEAELAQDGNITTQAGQQALTYLTAAKRILDAHGAPVTGLYGDVMAQVSRVAPNGIDAANYQMVAKYLSNAALQNAKALYGPRMSTMEVKLQLQEMNPNTHMQPAAIRSLIDENIRNTQYMLGAAQRIPVYLAHHGNPMFFQEWNRKYWPQSQIVNKGEGPVQGSSTAKSYPTPSPAAYALLKSNPKLAPMFKQQFGFLPAGY